MQHATTEINDRAPFEDQILIPINSTIVVEDISIHIYKKKLDGKSSPKNIDIKCRITNGIMEGVIFTITEWPSNNQLVSAS